MLAPPSKELPPSLVRIYAARLPVYLGRPRLFVSEPIERVMKRIAFLCLIALSTTVFAQVRDIRVPLRPQVSPDGQSVAFSWERDIWIAPTAGGTKKRKSKKKR